LNEENCVRKLRLLSLASLASETNEIPYSSIASTLQIKEEEIESWVILAVSAKLIEAKLDQLRRVAVVR
jgi:translation initiation factor 3 subunit M